MVISIDCDVLEVNDDLPFLLDARVSVDGFIIFILPFIFATIFALSEFKLAPPHPSLPSWRNLCVEYLDVARNVFGVIFWGPDLFQI